MPRISIQQFRAAIAGRADDDAVRAYRELARRPALAVAMRGVDWVAWPPAAQTRTGAAAVRACRELAQRPDLAAGARFADWPVWNGGHAATH